LRLFSGARMDMVRAQFAKCVALLPSPSNTTVDIVAVEVSRFSSIGHCVFHHVFSQNHQCFYHHDLYRYGVSHVSRFPATEGRAMNSQQLQAGILISTVFNI
jgi:hypothetical protein